MSKEGIREYEQVGYLCVYVCVQLGVDVSAGGSGGVLVAQVRQGGPADVAGVQGTR